MKLCKSCKSFEPNKINSEAYSGLCRLNPPKVVLSFQGNMDGIINSSEHFCFPCVYSVDWCSKWKKR